MTFDELEVGQEATFTKTVTEADVTLFAGVTGDMNPLHVDRVAAEESRFGGRVAHGLLAAGFVSAVLGTRLPGPGCIYLGQTLRFTAPVRIGDTVTAHVEIEELDSDDRRARLSTTCSLQDGTRVLEGEADVLVP